MNREIKFRAWNKPTLRMMYWGFFTDIFDKGAVDRRNFENEHNDWMQFTGLLDKNGKEIYEGDKLNYFYPDYPAHFEGGEVVFEQSAFCVKWPSGFLLLAELDQLEIVGNIYENPELV